MSAERRSLSHLKSLWRDEEARTLVGVDRLVYRSNTLGADLTLTNTGGGNTSSKLIERDPFTGEGVEVLWVKGSGGDLRTVRRDGFASLYADRVRAMKPRYLASPERGPKTAIEDEMYELYSHCVFGLNPRACSIDTQNASDVCPERLRPLRSIAVNEIQSGTVGATSAAATIAAFALSVSKIVSIRSTSTPPSTSAAICSA